MAAKPRIKAKTIDEYLAGVSPVQRVALEKLRRTIRSIVPEAEECISYGLAAFRLNGRPLVAFGAASNHCAFFPMDSTTIAAHADDLKNYETSKGTLRFQPDKPLPVALVRRLIKTKLSTMAGSAKPAKKRPAKQRASTPPADPTVDVFLKKLKHPLKGEIESIRRIILGVSPEIREGIRWNSPSFRTTDYFATILLRARDKAQVILHKGAKVKDNSTAGMKIADPQGLIRWLATDRCIVTIGAGPDVHANRTAFESIVRAWIQEL